LVRHGQPDEAVTILMATYGDPIMAFAIRIVRDRTLAEDVCQTVFLKAFQGINGFQGHSSLWSWLCSIAYRCCLDELRRRRPASTVDRRDDRDALAGQPDLTMDEDQVAKRRALERCLGKLPVPIRTQLLMRCYLGLSYKEIGNVVRTSPSALQVRISRILPQLRRCLLREGMER
jgi:RNA polymerase sigma-70 factor (ECF subfamily)